MLTRTATRILLILSTLLGLMAAVPALAQQDVITVGTVSGYGTVDVPVYIRDVGGTPLGLEQPPGSRIQSYSIKVNYSAGPSSVTFARAGITAALTPTFESSPSAAGTISLLDTFQEVTNLIPFTLNGAVPGNQVARLRVNIPSSVPAGTVISLTLDPVLTQLSDEAGSPATVERTTNGRLTLINGSITVLAFPAPAEIPTLGNWALLLLAMSLGLLAVKTGFVRRP
ncbi:hypothetical protein BH11PSE11_BH11PSE11_21560 [soil metagenome]